MMWLLGALGAVRRALSALWGLAARYPLQAALIASLCLSGWLWWGWNRADDRTAAALEQVAKWKTANDAATQWALAEKRAKETAATDVKETANDRRKTSHEAGNRARDDYASRNRCVRVAAEGGGQRPDLPRSVSVAGQPETAASVAELVGIDRPDFNACTAAALDLDNAAMWAADMKARGLAE